MKAVVFHGVGDICLDEVSDPQIEQSTDAIVRITTSAICGTDLHMIRGTLPGMVRGTIMGHEGVGVVEELGSDVRNLSAGDRVVIPSTIACGYCSYCRAGYYAQCDNANPNGPHAGTAYFGGPQQSGPFHGLQAEKARIPFANTVLVKLPDEVSDDQAIFISDIFPTGYFGAELAEIKHGDTVAVFGCGPVGQFAIVSAKLLGAGRILAVDTIPSRLETAQKNGAEVIDFNAEDPIEAIHRFTGGIGVDRAIDAVGIDANRPQKGPAFKQAKYLESQFEQEMEQVAPKTNPEGNNWHQGDAPSLVLLWSVKALAKAGSLSIIGVYPQTAQFFPIGTALNKNLTIKMGNCNHRNYIPMLIDMVRSGVVDPEKVLAQTHHEPLDSAIEAYKAFDERQPGWIKVVLETATILSV
ncbi:MAG: formaldehyde dehydrogenase [Candidatus Jettenia ecosi]|uniref:Formaldehyde dehydrogenase n=1 Tax=Candidatus Jettenia ecosi TaxID=2494326 RepID=A0A533Q6F1_9BACT|nr:MAG: formaldehyde dehydrogenase [Candidatus Jettenia ecosi]